MPRRISVCPVASQIRRPLAAAELLEGVTAAAVVLATKGYYADRIRAKIEATGATPNKPAMSNRKQRVHFIRSLYRERNRI